MTTPTTPEREQERQEVNGPTEKELTCIKCGHVWQIKARVIRRQTLTACPKCTTYNKTSRAR